jgi:ferritin-like metal-binding protein YciE
MTQDTTKQITEIGETLADLFTKKRDIEDALSETQQQIDNIEQRILPDLMDQANLELIKLGNGAIIELKDFVNTRIVDQDTAFAWLKEHGNDGIIKNEIKIAMPRGDNEAAQALSTKLSEEGIPHTLKPSIHHATLKSTVTEILNGDLRDELPREAFGVSEFRKVVFK